MGLFFRTSDYRLNLRAKRIGGGEGGGAVKRYVQDNCSFAWVRRPFYTRWAGLLYAPSSTAIAPHSFPVPLSNDGGVRQSAPVPFCAAQRHAGVERRGLSAKLKDSV